jgi:hypothetical protein
LIAMDHPIPNFSIQEGLDEKLIRQIHIFYEIARNKIFISYSFVI